MHPIQISGPFSNIKKAKREINKKKRKRKKEKEKKEKEKKEINKMK